MNAINGMRAEGPTSASAVATNIDEQVQRLDDVLKQLESLGDRLVGPIPRDAKAGSSQIPGSVPAPHVPLLRRLQDSRDALSGVISRINAEIARIDEHL